MDITSNSAALTGAARQYGMAKQVTALSQRRPDCRCLTIHWPGWEDVGMAARAENRYFLRKSAHRLMPVAEGIRHITREIEAGAPATEVVIVASDELRPEMLAAGRSLA